MYILNLARACRENSGKYLFLIRYHCWYEVNSKKKEILINTILGENVAITPNSYRQLKVFRYNFSEAIPIFFNRLKSVFFLVRSL